MLIDALKNAFRLWWHNLVHLTFFHFAWLICQLLIIPAPAATATIYWLIEKFEEGELVTFRDAWVEFRALFVSAWKWGALNLLVWGGALGMVIWAQRQVGIISTALGFAVLLFLAIWLALNLMYWALWFQQTDQSVATTYRNALVVFAVNPGSVLLMLVISLVLILVSALTILPLIHFLMIWLALVSTTMVQLMIKNVPKNS